MFLRSRRTTQCYNCDPSLGPAGDELTNEVELDLGIKVVDEGSNEAEDILGIVVEDQKVDFFYIGCESRKRSTAMRDPFVSLINPIPCLPSMDPSQECHRRLHRHAHWGIIFVDHTRN